MSSAFKDLIAWQRAIPLAVAVYRLTDSFPSSERFGLCFQMRRAVVSIASNIAEGYSRSTTGEYLQFLGHARGSNSEVDTQLVIAKALGFGVPKELEIAEGLCAETGKLINAIMGSLRSKNP